MKYSHLSVHLRFAILIVAICILGADTLVYAREQRVESATSPLSQLQQSESTTSPAKGDQASLPAANPQPITEKTRITAFTLLKTFNSAQIEAAQTSFTGAPVSTEISEVSLYKLSYDIRDQRGEWKPTIARVFIPTKNVSPSQKANYPLFVFGSGTTGMADKCAPSLENMAVENLGNYENHMIAQAAIGYVSVFPDYEGFQDPQETQAYFISESEAKVLLGSIQNLLQLQSTEKVLSPADLKTVFLSGFSQGGHAALSSAVRWDELPDDVKLKGVVQFAGAADVEALFLESPWLASYLVDSYTQYYGAKLDVRAVLQDRWLIDLAKNNASLCVNAAYKFYPHSPATIYTPGFVDAIETLTWPTTLDNWRDAIQLNVPLQDLPNVPYLSIQGATDPIVTAKAQRKNVSRMCAQEKHVTYTEYAGVNHFQIRQASFAETNTWMKDVLAGRSTTSSCP